MAGGLPSTSSARGGAGAGFTLIETLVALAVTAVLCAAIAAGLFQVAAADRLAEQAGRLALAARSLAAVRVFAPDGVATNRMFHGVTAERSDLEAGAGREQRRWEHWSLSVPDHAPSQMRILFPLAGDDR